MTKENKTQVFKNDESYSSFYIVSGIIIIVWFTSFFIIKNIYPNETERGAFGDSFGSINALFSGIALAGIIYTMHLQRKELGLQRKELRENRKELARTAKAQENSEKSQRKQAENLKITAKLNALTAMVEHYDQKMNRSPELRRLLKGKQDSFLRQIEEIIDRKEI